MGRSPSEILLEFMSTMLMSELALLHKKLLPATSQDNDHPREGPLRQRPTQPWNPVFPRLPAPPSLLHATILIICFSRCTSSRFGKFVSVSSLEFVALLATVQALCSLADQVLDLYRLDEIGVPHQVSCPRNSLHCTSSRCPATQSCLREDPCHVGIPARATA